MKKGNDTEKLQHILNAIGKIESILLLTDLKTFMTSDEKHYSVCMLFTIIGEAAGKLSADLFSQYPNVSWREMISMRNVLVHDYEDTDFKTVWDTAQNDLPVLKAQITNILAELQPPRTTVQEGMKKNPKI